MLETIWFALWGILWAVYFMLDGFDFAAAFLGAMRAGAVPIPVNTFLTAADYRYLAEDSDARAIFVSAELLPHFAGIKERLIVVCGGNSAGQPLMSFDDLCARAPANVAVSQSEQTFWLYSSGSTGKPKAVMHRAVDLMHCAELFGKRVLGLDADYRLFSASKMFFAYGLGNSLAFPLHVGATAILTTDRPTPSKLVEIARSRAPIIFCAVPTLYAALAAECSSDLREAFASVRIFVSAGEALPIAVAERWRDLGLPPILDGIGSTEAMHIFLSNRPGDIGVGSLGKPVPGYEIEIRDELGRAVRDREVGDLWCRGPSIATGYWNNPEATERTFVNGWLHTGDKFTRGADRLYRYTGRSDDMLKVGGIWVSPIEVEGSLLEHPKVLEAAVVGAPDADGLVKPKAFVVLHDSKMACDDLASELMEFVKRKLAPYKYPRWIEFCAELPKTATGKIRRHELRGREAR